MCYHELLAISYTFRTLISSNVTAKVFNRQVSSVAEFVTKRGNPFVTDALVKLHNFVTKVSVAEEVAERILNFSNNSTGRYLDFRNSVYVEKTK